VVGQHDRRAILGGLFHGAKGLEARARALHVAGEEKGALPEALAAHGIVGLAVHGEEAPAFAPVLLHPLGDHHHVSIGVGVDYAGAQDIARQLDRVEIGLVVVERGARAARVGLVGEQAQELAKAVERVVASHRLVLTDQGTAGGWMVAAAAVAVAQAKGQAHLPGKGGAQVVRQIGTVGHGRGRGAVLGIILAQTEVAPEEVTRWIADHGCQRREAQRRISRCVEQALDPRRVEVFHAAVPGARDWPSPRSLGPGACQRRVTAPCDRNAVAGDNLAAENQRDANLARRRRRQLGGEAERRSAPAHGCQFLRGPACGADGDGPFAGLFADHHQAQGRAGGRILGRPPDAILG
jgi:hypothetical protein